MRQQTIDLLLKHEKLIAHIARKFSETTGFDTEELISFGRATCQKSKELGFKSRQVFHLSLLDAPIRIYRLHP
jgi:hypothetical protein